MTIHRGIYPPQSPSTIPRCSCAIQTNHTPRMMKTFTFTLEPKLPPSMCAVVQVNHVHKRLGMRSVIAKSLSIHLIPPHKEK